MQQFQVIRDFEKALSAYTGAPFVTCVNSCTMALRLCLDWKEHQKILINDHNKITIPKRTYVSVPIQINRSGYKAAFRDIQWKGMYELYPLGIYDAARRFTSHMYHDFTRSLSEYTYMCVSFHYTKILGLGHGGAILHDDPLAKDYFMQMRHDGRWDGLDINDKNIQYLGHHCPMAPEIAAQGLVKLAALPMYNDDLPNSDYPDLSEFQIFK